MTSPSYETILVEEDGGVVTVTFNRPDKMNSYNWRMGAESRHAIWSADQRDDVRAIVVTGAGRAFCAGADLSGGGGPVSGGGGGADAGAPRPQGGLAPPRPPHPPHRGME